MQLGRPLSVVLSSWTRLLVGLSGWEGPPSVPHRWVELDILLCIWAVLQATFPVGQDLWLSSLPRGSQGLCSAMGQGFIPGSAAGRIVVFPPWLGGTIDCSKATRCLRPHFQEDYTGGYSQQVGGSVSLLPCWAGR